MKKKCSILICLILIFIANTILVLNDGFSTIDSSVYNFLIRFTSEMTNKFMHFITFFGSTAWIIALCAVIFIGLLIKKSSKKGFSLASLIIVSTLINNGIKLIIRRPRPEYITVIEHSFAYPSGHTMAACTVYGFIIYLINKSEMTKRYKMLFSTALALLIAFVGISRIYLGAHFFSDVFSGIILSSAILLVFDMINEKKNII